MRNVSVTSEYIQEFDAIADNNNKVFVIMGDNDTVPASSGDLHNFAAIAVDNDD